MARTLFVTGKLAAPALRTTLEAMAPGFAYDVAVMRITVAALMTTAWIAKHLPPLDGVERILIPGLCEGDVRVLEDRAGVRVEKGPADLRDLPEYFGQAALREEYGGYDIRIFAEINNVPYLDREEVVRLADYYRAGGADVIDLGCSLDRKLADAGEVIGLLKARGMAVSIDTFDTAEILAADRAGVDYLLSVNAANLDVAEALHCTVVVIPDFGQGLDTLDRNIAHLERIGRPYIVDPVIEPINFGFAVALDRYVQVRARHPDAEMLMGIGNITELTDADTTGVNALLIGFCQELGIRHVLTTEVIRRRSTTACSRSRTPARSTRPRPSCGRCRRRSPTRTSASTPPASPSASSTTGCSSRGRTSRPSSTSSGSRTPGTPSTWARS